MFRIAAVLTFGALQTVGEENKTVIESLEKIVKESNKEHISEKKLDLAIAYYKDQDQEKAFILFLESLDEATTEKENVMTNEEQKLYDSALALYLKDHHFSTEIADEIIAKYAKVLEEHPEYYHLNYLIALSYANKGQYPEFFKRFHQSYVNDHDHYLAYKTKAMLYVKLYERSRTSEEKEKNRQGILKNIESAIQKNEQDASLYRPLIAFTPDKEKQDVVKKYLKKIVDKHIVIPRADLIFYVQAAVEQNQQILAKEMISAAKEWYPNSRTVKAVEEYVDSVNKTGND